MRAWAAIGQIASAASIIDQLLDNMIWELIGVQPKLGACVTSQLSSNYNRFVAIEAITKERGAPKEVQTKLSKLSKKWKDLGELRNRAVHDPLAWDEDSLAIRIMRTVTRPMEGLTHELLPFDLEHCYNTTIKLRLFFSELANLRPYLLSELKSCEEKSPSPPPLES
jgi:hypothetical protein